MQCKQEDGLICMLSISVTVVLFLLVILMLQRATLAEKEVTALKEQLAVANQNQAESKMAAVTGSEELNRSAIEVELSAKDKEVCPIITAGYYSNNLIITCFV